jgi:hypothetical protein
MGLRIAGLCCLSLLLWQCAQVVAPQGGPIDETPPTLISSSPKNYSTHFKAQKIVLQFDEFIKLKNARDNMLFSPVLKHDPDFLIKKKSLIITLYDTLLENTTYTLNFNDAIVDITEENPLSGFQYIFSTGSYVDSLKLTGSIHNAFSLQAEQGVLVMLYDSLSDSIPYLQKPTYLSRTNEQGLFRITNMKAGRYKAFALADKNKNYVYDPSGEAIGFSDTLITLRNDTLVPEHHFLLFNELPTKQYLKSYRSKEAGQFSLSFNRRALPIKIEQTSTAGDRQLLMESNVSQDSLVYWVVPPDSLDTLGLIVQPNHGEPDTIVIRFPTSRKKPELVVNNSAMTGKVDLGSLLEVTANQPLSRVDTSLFVLLKDSVPVPLHWTPGDSVGRVLRASPEWEENSNYSFTIPANAVEDIYGNTIDTLYTTFSTRELKFYGSLKLRIPSPPPHAVLLLIKDGQLVKKELLHNGIKELLFPYLHPGKYGLKLVYDTNANGEWDPGNYLNAQQPERVTIYQGTITIRSNWDQEVEWILQPSTH